MMPRHNRRLFPVKDDEPKKINVGSFDLAAILNAPRVAANDDPKAINFEMSFNDQVLVGRIVERIAEIAKERGFTAQQGYHFDAHMAAADIANVHCNGCALRLLSWLMSDPVAFMADYYIIHTRVNRVSGGLNGEERPIFAEPKS